MNQNEIPECSRCHGPLFTEQNRSFNGEPPNFYCNDCSTDEEQYNKFAVAHYLVEGHYPDSEECHCFDEEQLELFTESELNDDLLK